MDKLLSTIHLPQDLKKLSHEQLQQLAAEMREAICRLACTRTAHFASNLGVVELTIALHTSFDFSRDRLVWDTGHQVYVHKMLTGRYDEFPTMRAKGGLMGYPNPAESDYDLFMTGHAGCSVATGLGLRVGDELLEPERPRHVVAVIGDGAFPSGIVYEAMNNAGGLKKNLIVVLNDNKMSICPRVGGLAESLDRLRMNPFYTGLKSEVQKILTHVPVIGDPVERFLSQIKDAIKAGLLGGMFFEDLGFRYIGPVDGHNIRQMQKYLAMVREFQGPVLLHVVTEKGHGFKPAADDPTSFHAPAPFESSNGEVLEFKTSGLPSYSQVVRDALHARMKTNPKITAITAAMCQGTMFEPIRDDFPDRFFDVGICESHAVAFAAGLAKSGLRPVVAIYSTFMQRSYDQIFQELALQKLPVTLLLDRAGLAGPDGPTHHGVFDLAYLRPFPNVVVMAPGDAGEVVPMLDLAIELSCATAIRYPKADALSIERPVTPIELGKAEVLRWGRDGMIVACGSLLSACMEAADQLAEEGLDIGLINARFVKPLDTQTILRAVAESPFVVTVEEGVLAGGFGSAVLEAACDAHIDAGRVLRLGIPDQFIEHGPRDELLADLGLDADGIAQACRQMAESCGQVSAQVHAEKPRIV
ncbi:MAG: 1-deoxy-D-xylulose-5-phosphate synthase [Thermoguttaceae bacterium]|jgi:1-deoxy-D-xylulose-5-phosphate synthase